MLLEVDIAEVDPGSPAICRCTTRTRIPEDVLMRLPRRSLAFDVPPEYVLRAVGVPYHP